MSWTGGKPMRVLRPADPIPALPRSPRSVNQIPGCGSQLAAVDADVAQGAVIQFGDAGELGTIAKISTKRVEKKCNVHD